MDNHQKDHTPRELLDRIIRLERENERLKEHISAHKNIIAGMQRAYCDGVKNTSHHIGKIYNALGDHSDVLWPTVYKVFPNIEKTRRQIDAIVKDQPHLPKK